MSFFSKTWETDMQINNWGNFFKNLETKTASLSTLNIFILTTKELLV